MASICIINNDHWFKFLRSIGLWRWYINITITILDIIHRPVFYLKHDVSETGFCLHLRVELTQLGPIDTASLCLWPHCHWWCSSSSVTDISRQHEQLWWVTVSFTMNIPHKDHQRTCSSWWGCPKGWGPPNLWQLQLQALSTPSQFRTPPEKCRSWSAQDSDNHKPALYCTYSHPSHNSFLQGT
jgi:hypothetical protein